MLCPKCRTVTLARQRVPDANVEIDYCPTCKGLWFEATELESIMRLAARDLKVPWGAEKVGILCPACREFLFAFKYPQTLVTVDMCDKCHGLWLDAGEGPEIKAVRQKLEKSGELEDEPAGIAGGIRRLFSTAAGLFR
jgi:Zn-finger nucleic acid-binding protein